MPDPVWYKFYDNKVSKTIPKIEHNIVDSVERQSQLYPGKDVFVCCGRKMNFKHLAAEIKSFASSLIALGIKKGDRVCVLMPNLLQFPVVHLAILKTGGISVPLNPLLTNYEIENYIKLCEARILITIDACYEKVKKIRETTCVEKVIVTKITDYFSVFKKIGYHFKYGKGRDRIDDKGFYSFTGLSEMVVKAIKFPALSLSDDAMLLSTGGRTGTLKLATITHGNLISNAEQVRIWNSQFQKKGDTMLGALPFFHSFGITLCLHYCMLSGIR